MIINKLRQLYIQVLIGVVAGVLLGLFVPDLGAELKPLSLVFITLIKMVFAPIIFATVVLGIAKMDNMKELGRVGFASLIYFEVLSTLALIMGLILVNVIQPGVGMNIDPAALSTKGVAALANTPILVEFTPGVPRVYALPSTPIAWFPASFE